ncbi:MAG TPA: carboxylesterase family protein [Candidatus Angelobacter sp.]|nr:carboxylesterase family protein [Candidatus Angelobacter sp.]
MKESLLLLTVVWSLCFLSGCGTSSPPPPTLSISTTSLSDGTVGASYAQTIEATGGVAPFNWSLSSGSLPNNLTLAPSTSNSATISGTPGTTQANVTFTLKVTDAGKQSATQSFTVTIKSTVAQTQSGAVQGVVVGDELAFRGIPYAAPPVGELRWKPPQPPNSWTGVRDASSFANFCMQVDFNNQIAGSEDCLYLNIFLASQAAHNQQQPVMVFIHGGGNRQGNTQHPAFLDAPPLATQGVIVVTVEYRLGLLGFFTHPLLDAEGGGSSGNYGLMDQIAALNWVHQNIAAFGGDPARVMLFGQSAGSYDVEALLTSPPAKGLFSSAGMESATLVHGQILALSDLETYDAPLVASLSCDTTTDVLACLRAVPAGTVNSYEFTIPTIPGPPVSRSLAIEPRVLPADPFDVLQKNGSPVPLLIGSTSMEESGNSTQEDPLATPPLDEAGYETAVHNLFDPILAGAGNQVLALYPSSAYVAPVYAWIAVNTDYYDTTTTRSLARAAAGANRPAVWRYIYTHAFENDPSLTPYGAFHTAELPFVFGDPAHTSWGPHTPTDAETAFAGKMMGYWSQFAKTGNPNASGSTPWPRYDASTDAMLQLDDTPTTLIVINGYHNTQCDYFTTLLP